MEQFSKAIQIVGIGSMDYMAEMNPYADEIAKPKAAMPPKLQPYAQNIKQEFYDMDEKMFREMLINQNTNECRSTYYPPEAWNVYNPDRFKTGIIKDSKIKALRKALKAVLGEKGCATVFNPEMLDYRHLLNFRILDALNARKILKTVHRSKV